MNDDLTHLSLFSGIGGIDLAAEWAGFRTVAQVEKKPYCREILAQWWPEVPRFDDVRNVTKEMLRGAGIDSPTLITGGFPCQPFSVAGRRLGTRDDRHMWPEMLRIISETEPAWVVTENVAGLLSMVECVRETEMGCQTTLSGEKDSICEEIGFYVLNGFIDDLESIGYTVEPPYVFPARSLGNPQLRYRVFTISHLGGERCSQGRLPCGEKQADAEYGVCGKDVAAAPHADVFRCKMRGSGGERVQRKNQARNEVDSGGAKTPHADRSGQKRTRIPVRRGGQTETAPRSCGGCEVTAGPDVMRPRWEELNPASFADRSGFDTWHVTPHGDQWAVEPAVVRVADGVPGRVDRIEALGNAVVPQQIYPILWGIAMIEGGAA